MRPPTRRAALVSLLALGATSCTSKPDSAPASPSPSVIHEDPPEDAPTGGPVVPATATAEDKRQAIKAATATMQVWVQGSTLDESTWRSRINATLTPSGQQSLETVWGYRIKDTALQGSPSIIRADLGTIVVRLATNYTSYDITTVSGDPAWLTAEIARPGGGKL